MLLTAPFSSKVSADKLSQAEALSELDDFVSTVRKEIRFLNDLLGLLKEEPDSYRSTGGGPEGTHWKATRPFLGGSAGGSMGTGKDTPTLKLSLSVLWIDDRPRWVEQLAYLPFDIAFHVYGRTLEEFISNYPKALDKLKSEWQDQLKDTPFMAFLTENLM